jgi:hypothetical protein
MSTMNTNEHRAVAESLDYTKLTGKIEMKNPKVEYIVFEDCRLIC